MGRYGSTQNNPDKIAGARVSKCVAFESIHPAQRKRIQRIFSETAVLAYRGDMPATRLGGVPCRKKGRNAEASNVLLVVGRGETPARLARAEETCMPEVRPKGPGSPRFYPVELPSTPSFHPELGYFLPSPSLRRKLRNIAVTALIGSAIVASTALALMPRPDIETASREEPLVAALPQPDPIEEAVPANFAARPVSLPAPVPAHAQGACDDLSTAFLAPECRAGRTPKGKAARAAHAAHRPTTVGIGRATSEPDLRETGLAQTGPSSPAAAEPAEPAAKASEPAAAPPKPKPAAKVARKPGPRPGLDAASADPGSPRGNPGGLVLPSLFGGDWAHSW
jgi:hypothetical protein